MPDIATTIVYVPADRAHIITCTAGDRQCVTVLTGLASTWTDEVRDTIAEVIQDNHKEFLV